MHVTNKIQAQPDEIEQLLIKRGVKAIPRKSAEIVLDFDATDDPRPRVRDGPQVEGAHRLLPSVPDRSTREFQPGPRHRLESHYKSSRDNRSSTLTL